jgi:hypothetical protein
MARLAALIPPPRHPLIRFHGVFAPNNKWRSAVVPKPVSDNTAKCSAALSPVTSAASAAVTLGSSGQTKAKPQPLANGSMVLSAASLDAAVFVDRKLPSRIDWATLLRRVYNIDALECPQCGGRLRFIELVEDKAVARDLLQARGLPSVPPPLARARAPDWQDN